MKGFVSNKQHLKLKSDNKVDDNTKVIYGLLYCINTAEDRMLKKLIEMVPENTLYIGPIRLRHSHKRTEH